MPRERRDRFGELVDDGDRAAGVVVELPHRCNGGWIDRDADHPRPCLRCRPHLAPTARPPAGPPDPDRIQAGMRLVRAALAASHTRTRQQASTVDQEEGP